MQVPLLDLKAQYQALREPILAAVDETFASGAWIMGPKVKTFEEEVASYVHAKAAIGCASGTDALLLSVRALDPKPGDEVIAPAFTFFATGGATVNAGATPVFVDSQEDSFNVDPAAIEGAITPKTRAIIPVHLFGQSADMDPIMAIAKKHNLAVIEDAAQSIGCTYGDRPVGSIGDVGCFSFYPSKNLGGNGDGGIITTNSAEWEDKLRVLRVHGAKKKYLNEVIGFNSRLDAVHAAILSVKLKHLDDWCAARQANAARYDEAFKGVDGIATPPRAIPGNHVFNQYTIRVKRGSRDALQAHLKENGIGCEIYYPYPLHLVPAFGNLGYEKGSLPVCEQQAVEALSIPIFPEMNSDQQGYVVETIKNWVKTQ